jgi:hypothetical protein
MTIRHLLAALAWLGLFLAPLATPTGAMAATAIAAEVVEAAAMPDGMPCCPETQKKPDCAKDCPFMAVCTVKVISGTASGAGLAPFSLGMRIVPGDAAKLSGLAQALPPRPPKA